MHYIQTVLGGAVILFSLFTQNWWLLLGSLIVIFCWALAAHKIVEGNSPAAASHPFWWSVLNDLRMFWHFITGSLPEELAKAGVTQAE